MASFSIPVSFVTEETKTYTPWGTPCSVERDEDGTITSAYSGTGNVPTRDLPRLKVKSVRDKNGYPTVARR